MSQDIDHYLGPPLVGQGVLGQTFKMDCDGLNQIEVTLGTFKGQHDQPVIFNLASDPSAQTIIFSETFEGNTVSDHQERSFVFEPIPNSAGQTYFFFLSSPTSTPHNALTARGYTDTPVDRYPNGYALAGQLGSLQRIEADFAFGAYCQRTFWGKMEDIFGYGSSNQGVQ